MKSNSKSIRLDDRVYNYINNYRGDGFNQKFENIILDAMESEKDRKDRIIRLDNLIKQRQVQIDEINNRLMQLHKIEFSVNCILDSVDKLESEVKSYV